MKLTLTRQFLEKVGSLRNSNNSTMFHWRGFQIDVVFRPYEDHYVVHKNGFHQASFTHDSSNVVTLTFKDKRFNLTPESVPLVMEYI